MSPSRKYVYRMPNPWPPDNIERLLEIAVSTAGLAPVIYKLIALWIEDRKARRIKIKHGEYELELQGGISSREIQRGFNELRKLMKQTGKDDLKITLPPGVDPSIPLEIAIKASQEKSSKKGRKK